jgi:hypothetical protein
MGKMAYVVDDLEDSFVVEVSIEVDDHRCRGCAGFESRTPFFESWRWIKSQRGDSWQRYKCSEKM